MNPRRLVLALLALPLLVAADAPTPAAEPVTPKEIVAAIPDNLLPPREDAWTHGHAGKINEWLQANYAKRPARVLVGFSFWKDSGKQINSTSRERHGAFPVVTRCDVLFSKSMEKEYPASGSQIRRMNLVGPATYLFEMVESKDGNFPRLTMTMKDPEIEK